MAAYRAPLRDMLFALQALEAWGALRRVPSCNDLGEELGEAVLAEAGRWSERELAPLAHLADREGSVLVGGQVRVPEPIRAAYKQFADGGWCGLTAAPEFGGQGLPQVLGTAVSETWKAANLSFSLCPMLTQGAVEAIARHGSTALQHRLLPKMVSGEWTGAMNLTEPQAGSDLAALNTQAVRDGEQYRICGRKIFITWGDHDMSDNIVHLVLARVAGAPEGVKGISMFAVPKFLIKDDGSPGERNDVSTLAIEHKLGIHGSPTCVLGYGDRDGAVGYLVGAENHGLHAMFTMMNRARLAVGVEGLAVAERAYQDAFGYARERVQGRAPGATEHTTIFYHPDVRRMLMTMKAGIEAMRGLAYLSALEVDLGEGLEAQEERAASAACASVLTPIVKGWCTELSQELVSLAVQVHGGMGYIEETGVAQWLRDVRITTIYEGTTGIQATDLVGRKLIGDNGVALGALLDRVRAFIGGTRFGDELPGVVGRGLESALNRAVQAVEWILANHRGDPNLPGAAAVNLLLLLGTLLGGWQLAVQARHASRSAVAGGSDDAAYIAAKGLTARFYAEHFLPRSHAYLSAILAGSASVMALSEEQFER